MSGWRSWDTEQYMLHAGKVGAKMKQVRLTVDTAMAALLPLLMAYSLLGEMLHEILGTAMLVLCITHHILNRRWYGALRKGAYGPRRTCQTILDLLLLTVLLLQPISGIILSKHLYTFLPTLPASAAARGIHMRCAYWGFVLMSLHAGGHLLPAAAKLKRKRGLFPASCAIAAAVSLYGTCAFFRRGFPGYLSGMVGFAFFDFSEPRIRFLLDHLAVMALFMTLGAVITSALPAQTGEHGETVSKKESKGGHCNE